MNKVIVRGTPIRDDRWARTALGEHFYQSYTEYTIDARATRMPCWRFFIWPANLN